MQPADRRLLIAPLSYSNNATREAFDIYNPVGYWLLFVDWLSRHCFNMFLVSFLEQADGPWKALRWFFSIFVFFVSLRCSTGIAPAPFKTWFIFLYLFYQSDGCLLCICRGVLLLLNDSWWAPISRSNATVIEVNGWGANSRWDRPHCWISISSGW